MTTNLEAAARQALVALESCTPEDTTTSYYVGKDYDESAVYDAITALRLALAEKAEQEPVALVYGRVVEGVCVQKEVQLLKSVEIGTELYAAPEHQVDLTDDDWKEARDSWIDGDISDTEFAQAVIDKYRNKNRLDK